MAWAWSNDMLFRLVENSSESLSLLRDNFSVECHESKLQRFFRLSIRTSSVRDTFRDTRFEKKLTLKIFHQLNRLWINIFPPKGPGTHGSKILYGMAIYIFQNPFSRWKKERVWIKKWYTEKEMSASRKE